MCGIFGSFSQLDTQRMQKALIHRGPDNTNIVKFDQLYIGHNLLSIVNYFPQPIYDKENLLVANCEIYNWKMLAKEYNIIAKNDADLLFQLLKQNKNVTNLKQILKKIDGVYAIAFFWLDKNNLQGIITKDLIGEKPLWYFFNKNNFYFASEKKAIPPKYRKISYDLNPRHIIYFDFNKMICKDYYKEFFKYNIKQINYGLAIKKVDKLINNSVKNKCIADKKVGVLLSGGVDSSLIAILSNKYNPHTICYNVSLSDGEDLKYAKLLRNKLNIKFIKPTKKQIELAIPKIIKIIETSDPVKVSVALPYYFASKVAHKDGIKIMLSGNGADDLFCGYDRFDVEFNPTKDTISKLRKVYDTDIYRDDLIFMHNNIELRLPYLDNKLIKFVLQLPDEYKITTNVKKKILRDVAKDYLPEIIYNRPKKAAQYGSRLDKMLEIISKENGFTNKGDYLKQYGPKNETTLGVLFSGGKDSILAMHVMNKMNYKIKCLITIKSENKDSYMFHTPTINLTQLQSNALQIPLISVNTKGKKEYELKDLKKALSIAKKKYKINGIVTGAIFSTYQRDRIDLIADKLGLKVFSPLWHTNQYLEVKQLINVGIKAIITKIAGKGLSKEWLGKTIDYNLLEKLNDLNKEFGFNVAGEGGEYESFVTDSGLFKSKLIINKSHINTIDEHTHELIIDEIKIENKK